MSVDFRRGWVYPLLTMKIALHGTICSGKSTIARLLSEHHGFTTVTLASPIYLAAALSKKLLTTDDLFPVSLYEFLGGLVDDQFVGPIYHCWMRLAWEHHDLLMSDEKPRAFLQDFGSLVREYDETAFIRRVLENAEDEAVCDDLRMWDEAEAMMNDGWLLVKVELPEEKRLERVQRLYPEQLGRLQHKTETYLADWTEWHGTINTDCMKDEMPGRVGKLLDDLRGLGAG